MLSALRPVHSKGIWIYGKVAEEPHTLLRYNKSALLIGRSCRGRARAVLPYQYIFSGEWQVKVMTISLMVLRAAVLLALILGIIFWANPAIPDEYSAIKDIHMLLGIIVVLALWTVSLAQGLVKGGNFALALIGFIVGLAVVIVGLSQEAWKANAGTGAVELINTLHLLLGLLAAGTGEMIASRVKRLAKVAV